MVKKFDDMFDGVDKAFDKMNQTFDKMSDIFDSIDFDSNIDDVHIKIQNLKDKYSFTTGDAIKVMRDTIISDPMGKVDEKVSEHHFSIKRQQEKHKRSVKILFILAGFVMAFGILFSVLIFSDKETETTPKPLAETSAPLNPTLDTSSNKSDIPKLKTIE
jgi:hypothetical protein